ncbi:MAG TPA: NAD(P)-dependent oxidoreductase [Chitinophagaceae bacterium]|nr:NAD(P)-dependent oxidoreductase [Chitinophagaceae bacterium]
MIRIGIVREGKTPQDNRTPFSPKQCNEIQTQFPEVQFLVQPSPIRCFADTEYREQGIILQEDISQCDILFGVKEALIDTLISGKTYLFFSHTKKAQPHNKKLMHALIEKKIRMIDYECLTHDDGHRVVGFGYWAGVVGAHNGLLTYGKKLGLFDLKPVYTLKNFLELKESYESFFVPPIKIVVTGSGRVSTGVLDILNYLDIAQVSPEDYLTKEYEYPVFTHLKGKDLYARKTDGKYDREGFHKRPHEYNCLFLPYTAVSDILMNGVYWDKNIPRLFELTDMQSPQFKLPVISDITCDEDGSVPCNVGSTTIADPTYGFDKKTLLRCEPFINSNDTVDVMAVDNLPNELPRDASKYFGGFLQTYVLPDLISNTRSSVIERATICEEGQLTQYFEYLKDYAS